MKRVAFICVFFSAIGPLQCFAANNWYVRAGAGGSNNGSDWNNAWNELNQVVWGSPTGVSAGDTLWLAGGTYTTTMSIKASGTSANRIYIKRVLATDAIPAAAAGWNNSFDSQVVINSAPASFSYAIGWDTQVSGVGSNVTLDGRIDSGILINIGDVGSPQPWGSWGVMMFTGNDNSVIQYVEVAGPQSQHPTQAYAFYNDDSSIVIEPSYTGSAGFVSNLTIRYCRLHGSVQSIRLAGVSNNVTIEHNWLYDNSAMAPPGEPLEHTNIVITQGTGGVGILRYNNIWNWATEGILIGDTAGETAETWEVYDNVWHDPFPGGCCARVAEAQEAIHTLHLYNNTIAGTWLVLNTNAGNGGNWSGSSQSRNNILWNCTAYSLLADADYDWITGSNSEAHGVSGGALNPFVNSAAQNYQIVGTIGPTYPGAKGYPLSAQYAMDFLGVSRTLGTAWDIGAYEVTNSTMIVSVGGNPTPGLNAAAVYPNPVMSPYNPTIRVCPGVVDSVDVTIFDVSGRVVNSGNAGPAFTPSSGVGTGLNCYEYTWTGHISSGAYFAVIHAKGSGTTVKARLKFAVIR